MNRPRISTNLAISIDGKISPARQRPANWTSDADHRHLLDLRRDADALLVGRGTLVADRMTLTVPSAERQPLRCVASRHGVIPENHPLFHSPGGPIHVMALEDTDPRSLPQGTLHPTDLPGFLRILAADLGVERLHCEGGGELIRALAELDAIDEFHLTVAAHTLFGGSAAATATGVSRLPLGRSARFVLDRVSPADDTDECFLSYRRK